MTSLLRSTVFAACLLPVLPLTAGADPGPLKPGTAAPAFATKTLDGKPLLLKGLRGKVVLLDVWATWCGPCREAAPHLQSLHQKFGSKGLTVIGLSVDDSSTVKQVNPYRMQQKLTYTFSASPDVNAKIAQAYKVQGIPSMFLIDQKGVVRWSSVGFEAKEEKELSGLISQLLSHASPNSKTAKVTRR